MQAGLLKDIIEIHKPTLTTNEFGEQIQLFEKYIETKAQVIYDRGNRNVSNNEIVFNYNTTFNIRYFVHVNETMKIVFSKKQYRIISIESDSHKQCKTIICELINE